MLAACIIWRKEGERKRKEREKQRIQVIFRKEDQIVC
jgi:hypothetical protein